MTSVPADKPAGKTPTLAAFITALDASHFHPDIANFVATLKREIGKGRRMESRSDMVGNMSEFVWTKYMESLTHEQAIVALAQEARQGHDDEVVTREHLLERINEQLQTATNKDLVRIFETIERMLEAPDGDDSVSL
jgi:hypothetical protein